jgi:tRNA-specific 2-thiouridylase
VTSIEPETGTVRVGSAKNLDVWAITAQRAIWTSGEAPDGPVECMVQVRAHGGLAQAVAEAVNGGITISLREPLTGVAKGQAVVLYRPDSELGDQVLGSGTIAGTESEPNTL